MTFIKYRDTCGDCGALAGSAHEGGCDIARCALHGIQQVQCGTSCPPNTWTGYWAGELEAVEFGFFTRWKPEGGWEVCGPGHPDARPDLNRIMVECDWNPATQRYVLRNKQTPPPLT